MGKRKIIVTINGKRKEFDVECEEGVVIEDCSFELKKKKVTKKNTLYVTGKKLHENGFYSERKEVATDVKLVALSNNNGLAYVKPNGVLYIYDGKISRFVAINVTAIGFLNNVLYFIQRDILHTMPNQDSVTFVEIHRNVASFSCGPDAIMFITKSGELYAQGQGCYGKLGDYVSDNHIVEDPIIIARNVKKVSVGDNHVLFITKKNVLYGIGYPNNGRLGNNKSAMSPCILSPIRIAGDISDATAGWRHTMYKYNNDPLDELYGVGRSNHGIMNNNQTLAYDQLEPICVAALIKEVKNNEHSILMKTTSDSIVILGMTQYNMDLRCEGTNNNRIHTCVYIINQCDEKVGDFDINNSNIAFIVE